MNRQNRSQRITKFLLYLLIVVLLNAAGSTLFFRLDLTGDRMFSLSPVSRRVVSTLAEPLTVHVFFTRNLPAPHNGTERYLRDLLAEYAAAGNRHFSYRFHDVTAGEQGSENTPDPTQELAGSYGIYPVQIQKIEKDEVKFMRAYMGLALVHGNLTEQIPAVTTTDGLEYSITTAIQKMNDKIGALVRLPQKIQARLYLSSSLDTVAPYLNLSGLAELPAKIETTVRKLGEKNYGKLEFTASDPSEDERAMAEQARHPDLFRLTWDRQPLPGGGEIAAGMGVAGIVLTSGARSVAIPLIQVTRIPLLGTQYQLETQERLEKAIDGGIENLIDLHQTIGVLEGHGAPPLFDGASPQRQTAASLGNLNALLSRTYSVRPVHLGGDPIEGDIGCLIVAGPKESFSDYELYSIDQFAMSGRPVAFFLDPFQEIQPRNQEAQFYNQNQGPFYLPLQTGLEKWLGHLGLSSRAAYALDESCYTQRLDDQFGGGEQPIYWAPLLKEEGIADRPFLRNVERLVMVKAAPLAFDAKRASGLGLKGEMLLATSNKGWEMSGQINLSPFLIQKPEGGKGQKSMPLAYLLEGKFPSFFAGKPLPEKPAAPPATQTQPTTAPGTAATAKAVTKAPEPPRPAFDPGKVRGEGSFLSLGKPGRVLLVGTSEILTGNVIDAEGRSPNALFLMNLIDHLNGRDDVAAMRSKQQRLSLLRETSAGTRTAVKALNIAGLPLLTAVFGALVFARRKVRQKRIMARFKDSREV